jgi:hypothetical protein
VALSAWAEIKAEQNGDLILLTFDHHTDTHEAFIGYASRQNKTEKVGVDPIMEQRLCKVDWSNEQDVLEAVADLRNDEQIDAALKLGLFSYAFCFNNEHRNAIPEDKAVKNERVYLIAEECEPICVKEKHADRVLESALLDKLITRCNGMAARIGIEDITKVPYVLDIDLDYFKTKDSLSPKDSVHFHKLIRGAVGITIATEPNFVRNMSLDENLDSDYALERILEHIDQAL